MEMKKKKGNCLLKLLNPYRAKVIYLKKKK